jgi:hypothetical protein
VHPSLSMKRSHHRQRFDSQVSIPRLFTADVDYVFDRRQRRPVAVSPHPDSQTGFACLDAGPACPTPSWGTANAACARCSPSRRWWTRVACDVGTILGRIPRQLGSAETVPPRADETTRLSRRPHVQARPFAFRQGSLSDDILPTNDLVGPRSINSRVNTIHARERTDWVPLNGPPSKHRKRRSVRLDRRSVSWNVIIPGNENQEPTTIVCDSRATGP